MEGVLPLFNVLSAYATSEKNFELESRGRVLEDAMNIERKKFLVQIKSIFFFFGQVFACYNHISLCKSARHRSTFLYGAKLKFSLDSEFSSQ